MKVLEAPRAEENLRSSVCVDAGTLTFDPGLVGSFLVVLAATHCLNCGMDLNFAVNTWTDQVVLAPETGNISTFLNTGKPSAPFLRNKQSNYFFFSKQPSRK